MPRFPFNFGSWLIAVGWLGWLSLSALLVYITGGAWYLAAPLFLILALAGIVIWLLLRLLWTVLAWPVLAVLMRRGGAQHGTAAFARRKEIQRRFQTRGPVFLGQWHDRHTRQSITLTADGTRSIFAVGTSGSGKSSSLAIPACLEWPHSIVRA